MTSKNKIVYMMLLSIAVVATSGIVFTSSISADADDTNKGIGETEVWEPGPTDGGPVHIPERPFDASDIAEYRQMEKPVTPYDVSKQQLLDALESVRNARIGIVASAVDYDTKQLVLYAPDITMHDKITALIGDIPFVLLFEEKPQLDDPNRFTTLEPRLETQSFFLGAYADGVTEHTYFGTKLTKSYSDHDGVAMRMEVHQSGPTLVNDNDLYTPAMSSANYGALEAVIHYDGYDGSEEFRIWDHNTDTFTITKTIDTAFMNKYSLTSGSNDYVYPKVEENSGTWYAYLYNFDTSSYEQLDDQSNDGDNWNGWAIWEEWNIHDDCASISVPEIDGDEVKVRKSGTWHTATSTYADGYTGSINCYSGTMNNDYYDWTVN